MASELQFTRFNRLKFSRSYKPQEEHSKTSFSREVAKAEVIEKHAAYELHHRFDSNA
jgi:hypothetical protein